MLYHLTAIIIAVVVAHHEAAQDLDLVEEITIPIGTDVIGTMIITMTASVVIIEGGMKMIDMVETEVVIIATMSMMEGVMKDMTIMEDIIAMMMSLIIIIINVEGRTAITTMIMGLLTLHVMIAEIIAIITINYLQLQQLPPLTKCQPTKSKQPRPTPI